MHWLKISLSEIRKVPYELLERAHHKTAGFLRKMLSAEHFVTLPRNFLQAMSFHAAFPFLFFKFKLSRTLSANKIFNIDW